MNDPDRYNAMSTGLVQGLKDTFAISAGSFRVPSCSRRGKGFCSGANMTGGDEQRNMHATVAR